jgi:hypothetical protein
MLGVSAHRADQSENETEAGGAEARRSTEAREESAHGAEHAATLGSGSAVSGCADDACGQPRALWTARAEVVGPGCQADAAVLPLVDEEDDEELEPLDESEDEEDEEEGDEEEDGEEEAVDGSFDLAPESLESDEDEDSLDLPAAARLSVR